MLIVDSSGSTLRGGGLSAAKGVVASLLEAAYHRRARVALLQVSGRDARVLMLPRRAPVHAQRILDQVGGGGGTPLRLGLQRANELLDAQARRSPGQPRTLVVVTDGRSRDRVTDLRPACRTVVVDIERGPVPLGRCRDLARSLDAEYLPLSALPPRT